MSLLFIGSTVADVVIRTPRLPSTGEDVNIASQQVSLGGCACNAFHTARLTGSAACTLFSPVGSGVWGEFVRGELRARGVTTPIPPVDEPNGCCYCLVEPDGERTFLCDHGAEYRFRPEWFSVLDDEVWDGVYLCGLEVEEPTGDTILAWLEQHPPRRLYFAPGPRLIHIRPEKLARLIALSPVFHLSATELAQFTHTDDVARGAALLHGLTGSAVIVTLGPDGAFLRTEEGEALIPGQPSRVVDTIGAGDAHIGAVMAAMAEGLPLPRAVARANRIAAAVVAQSGAQLTDEGWRSIQHTI